MAVSNIATSVAMSRKQRVTARIVSPEWLFPANTTGRSGRLFPTTGILFRRTSDGAFSASIKRVVNMFKLEFADGRISNFQSLFDVAIWRAEDKCGTRYTKVLCWIDENDAICHHNCGEEANLIWGEVEVGMGWEIRRKLLSGGNVYYRIHPTQNSLRKKADGNDTAGSFLATHA